MEFVFDSNMNGEGLPDAPDFLNRSDNFAGASGRDDIFTLPVAPAKKIASASTRRAARRKLPESFSDIEFTGPEPKARKRVTAGPKVNYVKSVKKSSKRKSAKKFEWTWMKAGWLCCGLLLLRLVFMESGLLDYHNMHLTLEKKENDLSLLRLDNAELIKEINRIKTSPNYQKKLARDHLGVIAKDEYLILFSRESELSSSI